MKIITQPNKNSDNFPNKTAKTIFFNIPYDIIL